MLTGLIAAAILMVGALVGASSASASTLYACVKKNGSAHLYSKKPKCKKGEKKLSWNAVGPAGKNGAAGANGKNGANGANGAVAGFFAAQKSSQFLSTTLTTVSGLEKALPAGSYILSANVGMEAFANSEGGAGEECKLSAGSSETIGVWETPLAKISAGLFIAEGSVPLALAISTTTPVTVAVKCKQFFGSGTSIEVEAKHGTLAALQASSIG